jgi:hypothetical protein
MGSANLPDEERELAGQAPGPTGSEPKQDITPAWEQIENGRYRPRRVRGSFRGRELG